LEEPLGHFLHLLAYSVSAAIPRHVVEARGAKWAQPEHLVTHGPFRLEAWKSLESIVLVRAIRRKPPGKTTEDIL
jgi:ABC-type oligopeptide transport system substrate-binding subunit